MTLPPTEPTPETTVMLASLMLVPALALASSFDKNSNPCWNPGSCNIDTAVLAVPWAADAAELADEMLLITVEAAVTLTFAVSLAVFADVMSPALYQSLA